MDQRQRRLARHEHELAPLLQRHRGRPVDQVRHRAGGERADRAHRAGAHDVGVDPGRAARVRALVVVDPVDRDLAGRVADEALEHLVAREAGVAVELGRDHLDAGRRGDEADLVAAGRERLQEPSCVGRARGAGDSEEDAHDWSVDGPQPGREAEASPRLAGLSLCRSTSPRPWRLRGRWRSSSGSRRRAPRTTASASRASCWPGS